MNRAVIVRELEKLARAIGTPLQENRLFQYVEDLQGMDESVFVEVCYLIRTSWERASFPPVGVFINKGRELSRGKYKASNRQNESFFNPELGEAIRRQEEYLKMDPEEYMALCIRLVKERG